jgi:hypothetical protein
MYRIAGCYASLSSTGLQMENPAWLDWVAGGLAIAILLGGLWMLLSGVSAMNQKK